MKHFTKPWICLWSPQLTHHIGHNLNLHQLLPSDPLITQMEVTFSPLKRSLANPKKGHERKNLVPIGFGCLFWTKPAFPQPKNTYFFCVRWLLTSPVKSCVFLSTKKCSKNLTHRIYGNGIINIYIYIQRERERSMIGIIYRYGIFGIFMVYLP